MALVLTESGNADERGEMFRVVGTGGFLSREIRGRRVIADGKRNGMGTITKGLVPSKKGRTEKVWSRKLKWDTVVTSEISQSKKGRGIKSSVMCSFRLGYLGASAHHADETFEMWKVCLKSFSGD